MRAAVAAWFDLESAQLAGLEDQAVARIAERLVLRSSAVGVVPSGDAELAGTAVPRRPQHVLSRDPLTGLLDRPGLRRLLAGELDWSEQRGVSLAVVLLEVVLPDRGAEGLMREAAARLDTAVRRSDPVGRWSAAELLVVCPTTGADLASRLAARSEMAVRRMRVPAGAATAPIAAIAGWAVAEPGENPDGLVEAARRTVRAAQAVRGHRRPDARVRLVDD